MDVPVLAVGVCPVRFGIREVADHRMSATFGNAARFLAVANQRRHVVAGAHQRVEHCSTDITRRAGQKDPHAVSYAGPTRVGRIS